MSRDTTFIEALIIDYVHRNGGAGERQAIIDYMELVEDYPSSTVARTLGQMASDGVIGRTGGQGRDPAVYVIDYDATSGWVEGT